MATYLLAASKVVSHRLSFPCGHALRVAHVEDHAAVQHPREVPSQRVQIAIVVAVVVILIVLDWLINDSFRVAGLVAAGAAIGLVILLVRAVRRDRNRA